MNLLKSAFLGGLSFLGLGNDRAVILMYHSVSPKLDYFMNVEPAAFERQMAYLKRKEYPVIPLTELIRRIKTHEPLGGSVVITFDDGYRDNYTVAFPILKKYRFPATIFVTTDLIGKSDKRNLSRLSIEEMREMEASGLIDIESHTKSHPRLSKLEADAAREEILGAKLYLESQLGKACAHFAYPYGNFNDDTRRIVSELFVSAFGVRHGTVGKSSDLFALPRASVDQSTSFTQFKGKLTRAVDFYEYLKR